MHEKFPYTSFGNPNTTGKLKRNCPDIALMATWVGGAHFHPNGSEMINMLRCVAKEKESSEER